VIAMPLTFRAPSPEEHDRLETLILDSFEPITWYKRQDAQFGPPNGRDWRRRWRARIRTALAEQTALIAIADGEIVAYCSGKLNPDTLVAFIDLLAVDRRFQGRGFGRDMLRAALESFRRRGAEFADLECLADNEGANALYRSEGFEELQRSIRWFKKLV
jgi:ribosomal protein S18 acetylase RimI-like enzyme